MPYSTTQSEEEKGSEWKGMGGMGENNEYAYTFPGGHHATSVVEGVGMFLFALYHVAIIIVLTNMLIAMMSHSFEAIQVTARRMSLCRCAIKAE